MNGECRSLSKHALDSNASPVALRKDADDGKAKPGPSAAP